MLPFFSTKKNDFVPFRGSQQQKSVARDRPHIAPASSGVVIRIRARLRRRAEPSLIAGKRNLLQSDRSGGLFIRTLYDYRAQGKFRLHEFVVMPDHFDLLITVDSNITIERAVQYVKGGFAFRGGRELGFRAPVWQKRFSEVRIVDAEGFQGVTKYIHNSPVARYLVSEAAQFPHSSAHPGFELDAAPQWLKPICTAAWYGIIKRCPDTNL